MDGNRFDTATRSMITSGSAGESGKPDSAGSATERSGRAGETARSCWGAATSTVYPVPAHQVSRATRAVEVVLDMHSLNALLRPVVDAIPRRALLRLGLGGVVGAVAMSREDAAGKRKKKPCLPCRQRKKGKCKVVQPDGTACPEGVCQAGVCGPKAPASPETRLDATCTGPADPDDFFDVEGNRFAQAFTPLTGGALVQAELVISKVNGSTGDFIVHLVATDNAGFPTDSVLASALLVNQDVAPGSAPRTFAFATPAQVVAGVTYALVLRRTDLGRLQVSHLATPTCGGQAFISNPVTLGYNALPDDLIFRTFIRS